MLQSRIISRGVITRPDFRPALRSFALALISSGDLPRAAELLEAASSTAADDPTLLNIQGEVYRQLKRTDKAVACFREALRLNPDLPDAHNNLGMALLFKLDGRGAEAALTEAIRIWPDFAMAHSNLAALLVDRNEFPKAQYHFEQAIRSDPGNAAARNNYGIALAENQMFEKAQKQLDVALRLNPNLVEAHDRLGTLLTMKGMRRRQFGISNLLPLLIPGSQRPISIWA